VDPFPDPLLLIKSGSAGNRIYIWQSVKCVIAEVTHMSYFYHGARGSLVVKKLGYKPEGRG
jgi:hypothetical protein